MKTWNGLPIPEFNHNGVKSAERIPDYMTETGAKTLAAMLLTVWHKHGHSNVTAEIKLDSSNSKKTVWRVYTNLIGGLPPRVDL